GPYTFGASSRELIGPWRERCGKGRTMCARSNRTPRSRSGARPAAPDGSALAPSLIEAREARGIPDLPAGVTAPVGVRTGRLVGGAHLLRLTEGAGGQRGGRHRGVIHVASPARRRASSLPSTLCRRCGVVEGRSGHVA